VQAGFGSTCRWKALRAVKALSVDADKAEAVLAPRGGPVLADRIDAGRDRERQRSNRDLRARKKTPRRGSHRLRAGLIISSLRRGVHTKSTEAGGAPSSVISTWGRIAARWSDAVLRQISGAFGPRGCCSEAVFAAKAASLGVERLQGARIEMSVAEVGERHLPYVVEVSREASREGVG